MKVEYINPFIESVKELFRTMLGAELERGNPNVAGGGANPREVTALIGLSGHVRGTVAISFPVSTALKIASRLTGCENTILDETVFDTITELVNIVAGGAKAKLHRDGDPPTQLSLPTVVRGNHYSVEYPSQSVWIEIPFTSELGPFSLRVTVAVNGGAEA